MSRRKEGAGPAPTIEGGALHRELSALLGPEGVRSGEEARYLSDATEGRGLRGRADAVALPGSVEEVAAAVAFCYERGVAIVPRGGGTGFAGGAVPIGGGVVLSLERLAAVRSLEPELWRMQVEAGVTTATVQRLARENGLLFPPDPGAAEQSQVGGNIATNAGGPHAFKYGTTGRWVRGLEAVVPPGEIVTVGGSLRKDVAGYDLRSLLIGSEGTLAVITAAWLELLPAPEAVLPVVGFYEDAEAGCEAISWILGTGLQPAALEYLDRGTLEATAGSFPVRVPARAGFLVIAEADGPRDQAEGLAGELEAALGSAAIAVHAPASRSEVEALWRWRDGVSLAVTAQRGGKVSEDIVVPLDRLAEAIEGTIEIGRAHRLDACSWGHAGDGNLHATFLVASDDRPALARAARASEELFELAVRLGGSVSGEHGLGWVRSGALERQWQPPALRLHEEIKRVFDPKGLLNPGKKAARISSPP